MTTPFEVITIWPSLSLMLTPINTCTLSFPAPSLYGTNYRKRLLMPLLFTRLKTLSHHTFIPHPFDVIITVFICICRTYTCISLILCAFVHPLLVKHMSYRRKKRLWLLPPDNRLRLRPLKGYWHRIGGNKATKWLLTPIGGTISHEVAIDTEGGRVTWSRNYATPLATGAHGVCGPGLHY